MLDVRKKTRTKKKNKMRSEQSSDAESGKNMEDAWERKKRILVFRRGREPAETIRLNKEGGGTEQENSSPAQSDGDSQKRKRSFMPMDLVIKEKKTKTSVRGNDG